MDFAIEIDRKTRSAKIDVWGTCGGFSRAIVKPEDWQQLSALASDALEAAGKLRLWAQEDAAQAEHEDAE